MSTGNAVERRRVEHEFGMYVTPFKARDEASMLIARNEPHILGAAWARPEDYTGKPVEKYALMEALAAFVVADLT